MYLGETHLSHRADRYSLMENFDAELDSVITTHRYVTRTVDREFAAEYDRLMHSGPPDGSYDGGDAIWDAEKTLGVTPWDVSRHFGLGSVARAVSLAEVVLAHLAAGFWQKPNLLVFPGGRLWNRTWERKFYKTCLVRSFDSWGGGFGTIRSVRDAYVHGYGVPVHAAAQQELARRLHLEFDTSDPTAEELALGYDGNARFFGEYSTYDAASGLRDHMLLGLPAANLTPLATYRMLRRIAQHVDAAADAVNAGLVDDLESTAFIKTVRAWWERTPPEAGAD